MASRIVTRRRPRPGRLYGLPLPSPRSGMASLLGVTGTGRLTGMLRALGSPDATAALDSAAVAKDAEASLAQVELLLDTP